MRVALLTTLLVSSITGQTVWIVDASGRGHFTDLPPALAAAQHGDTIVLRPASSYQGGSTSRGITLVAQSGTLAELRGSLTLHDLPAGRTFVVKSLLCQGLELLRCEGRVHVEDVFVEPRPATPSIRIDRCATVTLNRCKAVGGSPAVEGTASRITVSHGTFTGASQSGGGVAPGGMHLLDSVCVVGDVTLVEGGSALDSRSVAAAGIVQMGTELTLAACIVAAGGNVGVRPTPAVFAARPGSVLFDPAAGLLGGNGGPRFLADVPVVEKPVASVVAAGVSPGSLLPVTLRAAPGDVALLILGLPGTATAVAAYGHLWIDPAQFLIPLTNTIAANGLWLIHVPVPLDVPAGMPVALQAFAGQNGVFHLSAPAVVVIN